MKLHLKYLVPSVYEIVIAIFATLVVVVLANSRQLLNYYGLQSSTHLLNSGAAGAFSTALSKLDRLSITDSLVTFAIWAGVGMICFSIVQGIGRAIGEIELEEQVSSRRFIHPSTFTRGSFWTGVLKDFFGLALGVGLTTGSTLGFMLLLLPVGLVYCHTFLFSISFVNTGYFIMGMLLIFMGLILVDVSARVLFHRRHLTATVKLAATIKPEDFV